LMIQLTALVPPRRRGKSAHVNLTALFNEESRRGGEKKEETSRKHTEGTFKGGTKRMSERKRGKNKSDRGGKKHGLSDETISGKEKRRYSL